MKAAVCPAYGPPEVLQIQEVEKPEPKANEIQVENRAVAVTSGDCRIRGLNVPAGFGLLTRLAMGFSRPRNQILGLNFSGVVQKVGSEVDRFKVGDEVFGSVGFGPGAYAEILCLPQNGAVACNPQGASFEEAASLPFGGLTAIHFLRDKVQLRKDDKVLIYGASGSVGTAAIQLAKYYGAHVTAVCSHRNLELVKSLGADEVIDYTKEDFRQSSTKYDVVFETIGVNSFGDCRRVLKADGQCILAAATLPQYWPMLWTPMFSKQKSIGGVAAESQSDIEFIKDLYEYGKMKGVVDRVFPFEEIVEAHRYVDTGRKRGNVALTFESR